MDIYEIRRRNIVRLAEEHGSQAALGRVSDTDPGYIYQIIDGRRPLGERAARAFELRCRLENGWLDVDHESTDSLQLIVNALKNADPETLRSIAHLLGIKRP